jgi:hypothetical protein
MIRRRSFFQQLNVVMGVVSTASCIARQHFKVDVAGDREIVESLTIGVDGKVRSYPLQDSSWIGALMRDAEDGFFGEPRNAWTPVGFEALQERAHA